jgi:hypothetical protein
MKTLIKITELLFRLFGWEIVSINAYQRHPKEWDSAEIANGKCPRINLEYKIETFNPNEKWKS